VPLGDGHGQIAPFDAVVVLDEPLASRRPGVRPSGFAPQQENDRQPERTSRGARSVTGLEVEAIQPFQDVLIFEVAATQVRGGR
jgi:hypothetical protein